MSAVWGDRFRTAADLALFGAVVTVAALPVVTAGAAFAAGSFAMAHFVEYETWPAPRASLAVFRRRLRPGLLAGPAVLAAAGLVWLDVRGLHTGAVPGGGPAIVAVLLAAAVGAGVLGLVVVRGAWNRPGPVAAATGIAGLIAVLALLVHPVLLPALVGYALYALHVVARRGALSGKSPQHLVDAGAGHPEHERAGQGEHLVDR
jgi:hypothetical protein